MMSNLPAVPDYFGQFIAPINQREQLKIQRSQVEAQKAQIAQRVAEKAQELAQDQAFQRDVHSVVEKPSPEGYRELLLRYPKQREALEASWKQYSDGQQKRNTEAAASIYGSLQNDRPDLALTLLKKRRAALIEGGETTDETDALIEMVESGDPQEIQRAKGVAGFVLATATGPDKIGSTLEALDKIGAGGRKTLVVDGIIVDAETMQPIAQSPYAKVFQGPRGGFYEQPRAPGIPVLGQGGISESGALPGGSASLTVDKVWNAAIQQESGGRPGVLGPQTQYGRAEGMTQMLPGTAKEMAAKIGVPWRPEMMTAVTPEAAEYQERLGRAYFEEGLQKYGGDPEKALMYYHGGPDESKWGSKTRGHAKAVLARLGVPITVRSKQEYQRLPSGARYVAPDGSVRVKG